MKRIELQHYAIIIIIKMSKRRKQQKKSYGEEEEHAEPQSDLDNWKVLLPNLIAKVAESSEDTRKGVISKINSILTARPVGDFIKPYLNELVKNLHDPIFHSYNIKEHNEALYAICNICPHTFLSFEPYAIALINELLPSLDLALDDESLKFFAVGYVCLLSVRNSEYTTQAINKLFSFFKNKKLYNKMTKEAVANCIEAISMLLCCFSVSTASDVFLDDVSEVLERAFESTEAPILLAALNLFSIQSENLLERQYVREDDGEDIEVMPEEIWDDFVERFKTSIRTAPSGVDKKNQKAVREKSKAVLANIEGETLSAKITVNIQTGEVCGAKKLILMEATKKVAGFHFEQMMVVNKGLQTMFGIAFLDRGKAELLKLHHRYEIDTKREAADKERQLSIANKRRQKERRGMEEH
jgi:hypothetical protein